MIIFSLNIRMISLNIYPFEEPQRSRKSET